MYIVDLLACLIRGNGYTCREGKYVFVSLGKLGLLWKEKFAPFCRRVMVYVKTNMMSQMLSI